MASPLRAHRRGNWGTITMEQRSINTLWRVLNLQINVEVRHNVLFLCCVRESVGSEGNTQGTFRFAFAVMWSLKIKSYAPAERNGSLKKSWMSQS